jgi:hypothetical protein
MTDQSVLGKCLIFIPKNGNFEVSGTAKGKKKGRHCWRPKSREETPKEGMMEE